LAALLLLCGCGKFFAKTTGTGTSTGGSTSGDSLYVANSSTSLNSVAAFQISSGSITKPSNSPYQLGVAPNTLAITPNNAFLYAGSAAGAVYLYAIASDGSLTLQGTSSVAAVSPQAMAVDPSGKWLITAEANGAAAVANVFAINATTGALTAQGGQIALDNGSIGQMVFTPSGTNTNSNLYISLGTSAGGTPITGGVDILTFNSTTGVLTLVGNQPPKAASTNADIGLAINPAGTYLFVTETGAVAGTGVNATNGVRVFSIGNNGLTSEVTGSPYATGGGPGAVLVDATGTYLYVANRTASTISAYSIASTGALSAIGTAAINSVGTTPVGMAEDSSKSYLAVVCSGGNPDLEVFTFDSTTPGQLDAFKSISTGSVSPAQAVALVASP
jgi:6-phosphogluconolactonase (cycloisomerase 2 family)